MTFNRVAILAAHNGKDLSTQRGLVVDDIESFVTLVRRNPHKRVRVYSYRGFVPNSYKWRCTIQWIERTKEGKIFINYTGAQRPHGIGSQWVVGGRGVHTLTN